ncbi:MAG: hypothetical protein SPJ13_00515 [Bacteroidales bacterium]|nr:hypothetical protein [Bacteroidales bacterium]
MICIFNPEHDLCLANGNPNYLPPQSATDFANDCKDIMQIIYGADATCLCAKQLVREKTIHAKDTPDSPHTLVGSHGAYTSNLVKDKNKSIVPWGWDATIRHLLIKNGCPPENLPTEQHIKHLRHLQHRTTAQQCLTWLSQQTGSLYPVFAVQDEEQLMPLLKQYGTLALKAPLSGSGRGLHRLEAGDWQTGRDNNDTTTRRDAMQNIIRKAIAQQGCIMAEPWLDIVKEFAMEFHIAENVEFVGYSLFTTKAGVYEGNILLPDKEIELRIGQHIPVAQLKHTRLLLTYWISRNILPFYRGPLGVDMFIHSSPRGLRLRPVSEINLRHTMGLVAHKYLETHPQDQGKRFLLKHNAQGYRLQVE